MNEINVLSLFDGMSGAQQALDRIGAEVDKYYASEVDKFAIKITQKNYPDTIQLGSVTGLDADTLPKIDLLVGGSPCQNFSVLGKMQGMVTKCKREITSLEQYLELKKEGFEFEGQSYLFWEYVRLLKELMPKYFLLENVRVVKKWRDTFNAALWGIEPVLINSALVSAQNRNRYYWVGKRQDDGTYEQVHIEQPDDRGIMIGDILESGYATEEMTTNGKSYCVAARYNGAVAWNSIERKQKSMIKRVSTIKNGGQGDRIYSVDGKGISLSSQSGGTAGNGNMLIERPCKLKDNPTTNHVADAIDIKGPDCIKRVYGEDGKAPTLTTCTGGHGEPKVLCGASRGGYLIDGVRQDAKMKTAGLTEQMLEVRADEKTNTLTTVQKDNYIVTGIDKGARVPIIRVKEATKKGYTEIYDGECVDLAVPNSKTRRGRRMTIKSNCITTSHGFHRYKNATYRKLTPIECERLQTVDDNYTEGVSNSQRYKMLGNGFTIDVVAHILKGMFHA